MELVSDAGRVESRFSPFGDNVSVSARLEHGLHRTNHRHRLVHGLRRTYRWLRNSIGGTRWNS
jgi:hypothetical protein